MTQGELLGTFWDHIDALRNCVIKILLIILLGFFFCIFFYEKIYSFAILPYHQLIKEESALQYQPISLEKVSNKDNSPQIYLLKEQQIPLYHLSKSAQPLEGDKVVIQENGYIILQNESPFLSILSPTEGFITCIKLCLWVSLILTSPFWLIEIFKFLSPGLTQGEKKAFFPFILLSFILFSLGFTFAYKVTLPLASQYLYHFNSQIGLNLWSLGTYVDYFLLIIFANAFAFQLFVILIFLVHNKVITADFLEKKRRHMIVLAFIIGALLTPPDVLTQVLLAVPLIILFELVVIYSKFRSRDNLIKKT